MEKIKKNIKPLLFASFLILSGLFLIVYGCSQIGRQRPEVKNIIHSCTDERGLTSVVFSTGKDTFALDYLTPAEFDSMFPGQFYNGQILLPDYACPDTMIVMDGKGLTAAINNLLGSELGGDGDIDSVLHQYAVKY